MAQVHGGPSRRGQEGAAAPCWRVCARAHRCSLAVVERCEPDEAVPEGCSLEHEWRQRGGVMVKKTGSGLSSLRGQRKVRGSKGERGGEGWGCSGVYIGGRGGVRGTEEG
jgi:hypothetical protein